MKLGTQRDKTILARARARALALALAAQVSLGPAGLAAADEGKPEKGRITVDAVGVTSLKPDVAEIRAAVSGNAAVAADAVKKYRENRRRALAAFVKLKLANLKVDPVGPTIGPAANNGQQNFFVMNNMGVNANQDAVRINVAESIMVRLQAIDQMPEDKVIDAVSRIVDASKDAGLTVSGVQFKSTRLESAKAAAVRAAMQTARQKAELLASLSNARAGSVVAIREAATSVMGENGQVEATDSDETINVNGVTYQAGALAVGRPLAPLLIRATVNVEFSLERGTK